MKPTRVLPTMTIEQAVQAQFRLVDVITRRLSGVELMHAGDYGYGIKGEQGRPWYTAEVEAIVAEFFQSEAAALVWGAGTGAVRSLLMASMSPGSRIMIHSAPPYATTRVSLHALGLCLVVRDFNHIEEVLDGLDEAPRAILIQHTPQAPGDMYDPAELLREIKAHAPETLVFFDDNYTAMRVPHIGVNLGANASAFSFFKLQGPEGVGCVVGDRTIVDEIHRQNSSGGSKIQGPIALACLRGLVRAPVALALQAQTVDRIVEAINSRLDEFTLVKQAYAADVNERAVLIELKRPYAREVVKASLKYGAAPYPIGGESQLEIVPLFYRLASTFIRSDPELEKWCFRINPHHSGPETVLRILGAALREIDTPAASGT